MWIRPWGDGPCSNDCARMLMGVCVPILTLPTRTAAPAVEAPTLVTGQRRRRQRKAGAQQERLLFAHRHTVSPSAAHPLSIAAQLPVYERRNWLIHQLYVQKSFGECEVIH